MALLALPSIMFILSLNIETHICSDSFAQHTYVVTHLLSERVLFTH